MNVEKYGQYIRPYLADDLNRLSLDLALIYAYRAGIRAERKRRKASAARRHLERTRKPNRLERAILRTLAGNPTWAPSIFYITKTERRAAAFQWLQDRGYIRRLFGHYADEYPYCVFSVMPWSMREITLPERPCEPE